MEVNKAFTIVRAEYDLAAHIFGQFHSAHEGYAVIEEEFLELQREVFKSPVKRKTQKMKDEAVQVAAMAIRFLIDVC